MPVNLKALLEMAPFVASGEADGVQLTHTLNLTDKELLFFNEAVRMCLERQQPV